ncbi:hypothetical protein CHCC20375_0158 [Bacillus licheniformis]|nr:hypothetical protein CHCC20375_0158 [Bacillus licheniformis]TWL79269.1 hypothetical protein CHCC15320_0118 [Bacillus licheniformis]TWO09751.1 hypothetical protein CHCC14431_0217 [Bacillus licheniformis]
MTLHTLQAKGAKRLFFPRYHPCSRLLKAALWIIAYPV